MKKRLIFLVVLVLTAMALGSCLVTPPSNTDLPNDGLVFSQERGVAITISDENADATVTSVYAEIYKGIFELGIEVKRITDAVEQSGSEIAVGRTTRAASALAWEKIAGADPDSSVAYSLCYKDGTLAIVAVNELSYSEAMKVYIALISNGELEVDANYSYFVNKSENQYYDELYAQSIADSLYAYEHRFDEVAGVISSGGLNALLALYELYDEDVVRWMASLWDDTTGAFYYSNSALAYAGFAPDLESTRQALAIIKNTGFVNGYNLTGDANAALRAALPDEIEAKIVAWVQGLQSEEDGYFYHPQWNSASDARRGRDLDWAIELFGMLNAKPLYPTALDRLSGAKPTSSVVRAVAKAVEAQGLPAHLQSEEAFIAYLDTFDIKANSHNTSHTIASQTSQIKAAGLIDVACDYFDNIQEEIRVEQIEKDLPTNGLWQLETNVTSVTGLYKLGGIYNAADRVIKYSEDQIRACIECILSYSTDDVKLSDIIYVFNPWAALNVAFNSIKRSINAEDEIYTEADLTAGYALVRENAEEMIAIAAGNLSVFKKPDGGFSYFRDRSHANMQGSSAGLGLAEGDYNATNIAVHSIPGMITNCLGVEAIPRFNCEDLDLLLEIIDEAGEISKIELEYSLSNDFDDIREGDLPVGYAGFESVAAPTEKNPDNRAILLSSPKDTNVNASISLGFGSSFSAAYYEMDMMVGKGANGYTHQIYFQGDSAADKMYLITVKVSGGMVSVDDASFNGSGSINTPTGITFPVDEWHNLRWEFYVFTDQFGEKSLKTKIFFDGEFVAISDNYWGKEKGIAPVINMEKMYYFTLKAPASDLYVDNVDAEVMSNAEWSEEGYAPLIGETVEIDFDEKEKNYYSSLGYKDSKVEIVESPDGGDGNALKYTKTDKNQAGENNIIDTYGFNAPAIKSGDTFYFEADIYIDPAASGGGYQLCIGSFGSKSLYMMTFTLSGGSFAFGDSWNTGNSDKKNSFGTYSCREWHTLSVELLVTDDPDEFFVTIWMDDDKYTSTNYYNNTKVEGATPSTNLPSVEMRPLKATVGSIYFDNIYMEFYE